MPQGLQVWNASGQIMLDITDRVIKSIVMEAVVESGSEVIPHTGADDTSTILAIPLADSNGGDGAPLPTVTVGGGNVTVTWGADGRGSDVTRNILLMEF
jgi:hypothetical protein